MSAAKEAQAIQAKAIYNKIYENRIKDNPKPPTFEDEILLWNYKTKDWESHEETDRCRIAVSGIYENLKEGALVYIKKIPSVSSKEGARTVTVYDALNYHTHEVEVKHLVSLSIGEE